MFSNFPNLLFVSSTLRDGNMSLTKGDKIEVLKNRQNFLKKIKVNQKDLLSMNLVHGSNIKHIQDSSEIKKDAPIESDALLTNCKNAFLFMLTGDCIPLAFFDPNQNIIALAHISRLNLEAEFIKKIGKSFKELKSSPENILVKFGPSLGPCCYKPVYPEKSSPLFKSYITNEFGEPSLDIWKWTENELISAGIKKENIENPKVCTYHSGNYFSHRKYKKENLEHDGRLATALGLRTHD